MSTKEQCLAQVSRVLGEALMRVLASDPVDAAQRAHRIGGPSVGELEIRIRAFQAEGRAKRSSILP